MAPVAVTEDYYMILGIDQTADLELIKRSYRQLALKLHPDHNAGSGATEAFQKLVRAYDTLKTESERRKYDLIYPSIRGESRPSQHAQQAYGSAASTSQSGTLSEAAQIAALQKAKQERTARWRTNNTMFESSIFEIKRAIRQVEQKIRDLESICAAEAAVEAQKNSWSAWLLSPIYKKAEESSEQKALKDRAKQERRVEKDMKERRLEIQTAKLKATETSMKTATAEMEAANSKDEAAIQFILYKIRIREQKQRQEREKAERERLAQQMRRQQEEREKRQREAAEQLRKQQAAERATEQKRQKEETERWEKMFESIYQQKPTHSSPSQQRSTHSTYTAHTPPRTHTTSSCDHDGWWPKVQGRTACPKCSEIWTYLLQCPGCAMQACPRCQAAVRPRRGRNAGRRAHQRVRTPSPDYGYDYDYF